MPPFAPARAWFLALTAVAACNDPPPPNPTKLSEQPSAFVPEKPPRSATPSPFRNPEVDPPPPRSEPQLPPAELAAALAATDEALKVGDQDSAITHLRTCANRVPQSARCEGELAMLLVKKKRFTAEARYYIEQVIAAADDPGLDDAYYRRFGAAMLAQGRSAEAAIAYERMIARTTPTAADWHLLSTALQGLPERLADAADAARKAYELDPTHPEWLREEAILLSQMPDKIAQSLERFTAYKAAITDPALLADTDRRMAELRMIEQATNKPPAKQRKQKPASG